MTPAEPDEASDIHCRLDELLEAIALQAEILELRANPHRAALGAVIGFMTFIASTISSVSPVGSALATASVPILPPAPPRFSTTTGRPRISCSASISARSSPRLRPAAGIGARSGRVAGVVVVVLICPPWGRRRPPTVRWSRAV